MVLNTSFNENEPVVCEPTEALDCFLRTQMDVLVMGETFIERRREMAEPHGLYLYLLAWEMRQLTPITVRLSSGGRVGVRGLPDCAAISQSCSYSLFCARVCGLSERSCFVARPIFGSYPIQSHLRMLSSCSVEGSTLGRSWRRTSTQKVW